MLRSVLSSPPTSVLSSPQSSSIVPPSSFQAPHIERPSTFNSPTFVGFDHRSRLLSAAQKRRYLSPPSPKLSTNSMHHLGSRSTLQDTLSSSFFTTLNSTLKSTTTRPLETQQEIKRARKLLQQTLQKGRSKDIVTTIHDKRKTFHSPEESFELLRTNKIKQMQTLYSQPRRTLLQQNRSLMPGVRIGPSRIHLHKSADFFHVPDQASQISDLSLHKQPTEKFYSQKHLASFSKVKLVENSPRSPLSVSSERRLPPWLEEPDEDLEKAIAESKNLHDLNCILFLGGLPQKIEYPPSANPFHEESSSQQDREDQLELRANALIGKRVNYDKKSFRRFYAQKVKNRGEKFFVSFHDLVALTWKPESREASVLLPVKSHAYLFGGKNRSLLDRVEKLIVSPHPDTMRALQQQMQARVPKKGGISKVSEMISGNIIQMSDPLLFERFKASWTLMTPNEASQQINGRFGHTGCCLAKRFLFYFGGERRYNEKCKIRECLNDLICFDIQLKQWGIVRPYGPVIPPRKYACLALIGQVIIVHGGINDFGHYLRDVCIFDLKTRYWRILPHPAEISYEAPETGCIVTGSHPVAMAGSVGVFYKNRYREEILVGKQLPPERWGRVKHFIRYEGIYVFGGKITPTQETNQLKILRFAEGRLKWVVPSILGKPPEPRYQHSLDFYRRGNCLIVHGGRCDSFGGRVYNDMFILRLDSLEWVKVTYQREIPVSLFNHSSCIIGDHLLAYGGMKDGYKISNELRLFQLSKTTTLTSDQKHLNRKIDAFKDKLKKVLFNAIFKDYMQTIKQRLQQEMLKSIEANQNNA